MNQHHRFRRFALLFATATVASLTGCGIGFNENTGDDGTRGVAQELSIGVLRYDRVDAARGDHTDWKRFDLEDDREVTIRLWWIEPDRVRGRVTLHDQRGQALEEAPHDGSRREHQIGPLELQKGTYFLQFEATSGGSDYAYEVKAGHSPASGPILD